MLVRTASGDRVTIDRARATIRTMNVKTPERAVVLVSGGMDSAVVLALARERGLDCYALSVSYGQRHGAGLQDRRLGRPDAQLNAELLCERGQLGGERLVGGLGWGLDL